MIGWIPTTEVLPAEKHSLSYHTQGQQPNSLIKFNVKANCSNAGQIHLFGVSMDSDEKETIIPPYSAFMCVKKEQMGEIDYTDKVFEEEKKDEDGTVTIETGHEDKDSEKEGDMDKTKKWKTVLVLNLAKDGNKNIQNDIKCSF
ncbi:unnamed protein product [Moneuplotes crassus]|uniref:Uncharacterized protein n=1 Tax=Euplotes crassus TaxID=5936 RepID=A0AAD1XJ78_EUPCR|nr:unnamed protein product [Moneuplotes crassus]